MQTTVTSTVPFSGIGLHTGQPVNMIVHPASVNHGIGFVRSDVRDRDNVIPARYDRVVETLLSTTLANSAGVSVRTIEHVMAGLAACGIVNARIELDGPEVPIMDGSALPFARELLKTGIRPLDAPIRVMRVRRQVTVAGDGCSAMLEPSPDSQMEFRISFPDPIGSQERKLNLANGAIVRDLVSSRTFCLKSQIAGIRSLGFGKGGDERVNVLIADDDRNEFLLKSRHEDECVRHKMLDAVGDLALAGCPVVGTFKGYRSGHAVTIELLRKLFDTPGAFEIAEADPATASFLPGAGASPADIPTVH